LFSSSDPSHGNDHTATNLQVFVPPWAKVEIPTAPFTGGVAIDQHHLWGDEEGRRRRGGRAVAL
jgi:hypothetical protein